MKGPILTNPIDIKLAALVARKKAKSVDNNPVDLNKLWPSTLSPNTRSAFTSRGDNYSHIVKVDRNYNG
jgi:hypothetical protein